MAFEPAVAFETGLKANCLHKSIFDGRDQQENNKSVVGASSRKHELERCEHAIVSEDHAPNHCVLLAEVECRIALSGNVALVTSHQDQDPQRIELNSRSELRTNKNNNNTRSELLSRASTRHE